MCVYSYIMYFYVCTDVSTREPADERRLAIPDVNML